MVSRIAAMIYVALDLVLAAFILSLALGIPWRSLTLGRVDAGRLSPTSGRAQAVLTTCSLLFLGAVVAVRAGLIWPQYYSSSRALTWIAGAFDAFGVVVFAIARSFWARAVWAPVLLVLTICVAIVLIASP